MMMIIYIWASVFRAKSDPRNLWEGRVIIPVKRYRGRGVYNGEVHVNINLLLRDWCSCKKWCRPMCDLFESYLYYQYEPLFDLHHVFPNCLPVQTALLIKLNVRDDARGTCNREHNIWKSKLRDVSVQCCKGDVKFWKFVGSEVRVLVCIKRKVKKNRDLR